MTTTWTEAGRPLGLYEGTVYPTAPHTHATTDLTDILSIIAGSYIDKSGGDIITNITPGNVGFTVKGHATQSADLQRWENSSGTMLAAINSTGGLRTNDYSELKPSSAATVVLAVKGFASQTANLQEWQNSAGSVLARINSNGSGIFDLGVSINGTNPNTGTSLYVVPSTASNVVAIIRGAASQTANLQEWQNSAGNVQASVDSAFRINAISGLTVFGASTGVGTGLLVQTGDATRAQQLIVSAATQSVPSFIVRGGASQTADLQQWQNSGGTSMAAVDALGGVHGSNTYSGQRVALGGAANIFTTSTTQIGMAIRGIASQSANLQEWQNSSGTILATINSSGAGTFSSLALVMSNASVEIGAQGSTNTPFIDFHSGATNVDYDTRLIASGGDGTSGGGILNALAGTFQHTGQRAGSQVLVAKGAASQSADLQQWQNSAGSVLARVNSGGELLASTVNAGTTNVSGAQMSTISSSTSNIGLVVRKIISQTANMQEWQDQTGANVSLITKNGNGRFNRLSVREDPDDSATGALFTVSNSGEPTAPGFILRSAAGQSSDIFEFRNSSNSVILSLNANGRWRFTALQEGTAALGAYVGYVDVIFQGNARKMPVYA